MPRKKDKKEKDKKDSRDPPKTAAPKKPKRQKTMKKEKKEKRDSKLSEAESKISESMNAAVFDSINNEVLVELKRNSQNSSNSYYSCSSSAKVRF